MKRALVAAAAIVAAACGGSSSPAAPTTNNLSAPSSFVITLQQVFMTSNTVAFSWASTGATTYKISIGTTTGGSDMLNAEVTGTSYTWTAPRTAVIYYARVAPTSGGQTGSASTEIAIFTIDLRYVIDAMYFGQGPMADIFQPTDFAAIWPDGATIGVIVTDEAGQLSLDATRDFVSDYLAVMSNHIAINIATTPVTWKGVALSDIPENTIVVRVDNTLCAGPPVIACAFYGPQPYGTGRSAVNLNIAPNATTAGGSIAISHEMGHAFGWHHVRVNSSTLPELRFLMNPGLLVSRLSDVEKNAIIAARAGGMRANWTRSQAIAAGLVVANAKPAFFSMPPAILPILRDAIESGSIR